MGLWILGKQTTLEQVMSEWMKRLIESKGMVICDFCHIPTKDYVEDWVKINDVKKTFNRCSSCQKKLEEYSKNPGDGIDNI